MPDKTFMQHVFESAKVAAEGVNAEELKGISKEQFIEAVRLVTEGLDKMPTSTSVHAALYAVTYIRNALILTLQEGIARMEQLKEPTA